MRLLVSLFLLPLISVGFVIGIIVAPVVFGFRAALELIDAYMLDVGIRHDLKAKEKASS